MAELFASADLTLCLGSAPEGFGLVCVESVLCGTPVLARDAGAQLSLLPPGHGCFVAPVGDDALAAAAHRVLISRDVAEQTRTADDMFVKPIR
jgi:glycosyltransferase involved in cell wall biosynthesis